MPKVSICIPAYNQVEYLTRTLDSVLLQTYQDYEVIITDDTPGLLVKELVEQYNFNGRLHYFKNESPLGSPKNWNFCISKAGGAYIKILHHDDWFSSPNSLAEFVNAMAESGAAMVFSGASVVFEKSNQKGTHSPTAKNIASLKDNASVLFLGNFIGAPSMIMYKRDEQIIFDENLIWLVDIDFYIRYLNAHKKFTFLQNPLITILAEGETTVTAGCLNNKNIEVFENCYLFNKLKPTLNTLQLIKCANFLLKTLNRFNILSLNELKLAGYNGGLPLYFHMIFNFNKIKTLAVSKLRLAKHSTLSILKTGNENS